MSWRQCLVSLVAICLSLTQTSLAAPGTNALPPPGSFNVVPAGIGALGPILTPVDDETWGQTAVRKVLHTFAFGGQATDHQIDVWADLPPAEAIRQILKFDRHNLRLSRPSPDDRDGLADRDGTLRGLADFWASNHPQNRVNASDRSRYLLDDWQSVANTWLRATLSRGLNPFRQKLGFWETNYHMSVNQRAGVSTHQVIRYFDDILSALAQNQPYRNVVSTAAKSAAVARQYRHYRNRYVNGECECNEDFAREYHQLFHGILGKYDAQEHELVTIKNTAAALTDLTLNNVEAEFVWQGASIDFGTENHYPGDLRILKAAIPGRDARQRINALSEHAIAHPESLANLPIMIIQGLADDALTDARRSKLRRAWRAMPDKNLLEFLRAYAISTMFHSRSRVKYWNSFDRFLTSANLGALSNEEHYFNLYETYRLQRENVWPFTPKHDVFGGQTGLEASESADIFRENYNSVTEGAHRFQRTEFERLGRVWKRDWSAVLPRQSGVYLVRDAAAWLWQRFVADGLRNLGPLERAHLYALLATGKSIGDLATPDDRTVTTDRLRTDAALAALVESLGEQHLDLTSAAETERRRANRQVGQGINFILGTPFVFAQEGR